MLTVDKLSRIPIYEQLIRQFEYLVLSGEIPENGLLPSVRSLSQSLGINPNTIQRTYAEMERKGLCYSVAGSGRYLTANAMVRIQENAISRTTDFRELAASLMQHGIPEENLIDIIRQVYHEQGKAVKL